MARRTPFWLLAFLALASAAPAEAASITWSFEGRVVTLEQASPETLASLSALGVEPGSSFAGQFVFDSAAVDSDPLPGFGRYLDALSSFDVTIGSYHASVVRGDPYVNTAVNADAGVLGVTGYGPGANSLFGSPILSLTLLADSPMVFASDALPEWPPDLASLHPFDRADPILGVGTALVMLALDGEIYAELTSLQRVPEPGVACLAVLAFAGLAARALSFRSVRLRAPGASRPRSGRAGAGARPGS